MVCSLDHQHYYTTLNYAATAVQAVENRFKSYLHKVKCTCVLCLWQARCQH
jgi:hypothetical protein